MANVVEITIKADDATGPAFASAIAQVEALKKAAHGVGFNLDAPNLASQLLQVKQKMQSVGLADLLDFNLNQGQIGQQLLMLKRKIQQAGVSDLLDVNLNQSQIQDQLAKVANETVTIPVGWDISKFPKLGEAESVRVPIKFDIPSNLGSVLPKLGETVNVNINNLQSAIQGFRDLGVAAGALEKPLLDVNNLSNVLDASLAHERSQLDSLGKGFSLVAQAAVMLSEKNGEAAQKLNLLEQGGLNVAASMEQAYTASKRTSSGFTLLNGAVAAGIPMWTNTSNLWWGLGGRIKLFGGDLAGILPHWAASVSAIHLLADGIVEIIATLVPAAIAFAAFGVGATDSVMEIYSHMQNLDKAADELGGSIYPLTGGFTKLSDAVQPEVWTLFGEGLIIANKNAGIFTQIAKQAGSVVDQLGARLTVALTNNDAFSRTLKNGSSDLSGWGNLIGNVGGILGNFIKAMPGYAEILLGLANGFTHVIEVVTGSGLGQGLINIGIAAHGALLYIGLAATLGSKLVTGTFSTIGSVATKVADGVAGLGKAGATAAEGLDGIATSSATLAALPWGWLLVAGAGLVILATSLGKASDAATNFNKALETAVQNSTIGNLSNTLASTIAQAEQKVASSQRAVTDAQSSQNQTIGLGSARLGAYANSLTKAISTNTEYRSGLATLTTQQQLVQGRLADLSKAYGGNANALSLLNAAGITTAQITSNNKETWAQAKVEIEAQNDAIRALTGDTGRYAAALNALSGPEQFMGDLLKSIQSIAQAQANLITEVTQGETTFDTFGQGIATLKTNFDAATQATQNSTDTVGKLSSKVSLAGAAMGGLTQADLALNQAFYTQIGNAQGVIGALEEQEISTKDLTTASATLASQMLPFAGNNEAARASLVAMINDALGPGTVSLQNLNTWVKNNTTSMQGLDNIVAQSTIKAGTLANVLENSLTAQFHAALLETTGADKQLKIWTSDIVHNTTTTDAGKATRAKLIADLEASGIGAKQATTYVDNLNTSIAGLKGKTIKVTVLGGGGGTITFNETTGVGQNSSGGLKFEALGQMLTGGTPGKDSVPFIGMPGEAVLPVWMVKELAPILAAYGLRGMSPMGMAQGGLIGPGNVVNAGSSVVGNKEASFVHDVELAFAQAAIAKAKADAAAAAAKAAAASAGPGGGAPAANAALAQKLYKNQLTASVWAAWNNVAMRESGWNQFARNASSGAYGIPQALPPTKMPFAAQAAGGSNPTAQIEWMWNYMAGRYGGPIGAWQHELSAGWYDNGGWLPQGWSMAYNGTNSAEHVPSPQASHGGGGCTTLEVVSGGQSMFETFMLEMIRNFVRVKGGGDTQAAFGRN